MAQWVCYTKKMLAAAITHLADEIEQTVEDFNDVVQGLSSQQLIVTEEDTNQTPGTVVSKSEININVQPAYDPVSLNKAAEDVCKNDLVLHLTTMGQPKQTCHIAATKQPTLSYPARQPIEAYHVTTTRQPETSGFTTVVTTTLRKSSSFEASGPSPSGQFKSISSTDHHKPVRQGSTLQCRSPVSEVITRDCIPAVSHKSHQYNNKKPGKVVQISPVTQTSSQEMQNFKVSNSNVINRCLQENMENSQLQVVVERATSPAHWLSLSSIKRVLSLAFSQMANILLTLGEESQSQDLTSPALNRQLSYQQGQIAPLLPESHQFLQSRCPEELNPSHPSLIRSAQSCESFEIIEQPTDEQDHCLEYVGSRPVLFRLFSRSTDNLTELQSLYGDIYSSSTEFCQFNVKHLLDDQHLNQEHPLDELPAAMSALCQNDTPQSVQAFTSSFIFHDDGLDDNEDNESFTFTVISENDDEEDDFIVLQLTSEIDRGFKHF